MPLANGGGRAYKQNERVLLRKGYAAFRAYRSWRFGKPMLFSLEGNVLFASPPSYAKPASMRSERRFYALPRGLEPALE